MNNEIMISFSLIITGLILMILGLSHINPSLNRWDSRTFQYINTQFSRYSRLFRFIWPLGTTPVCILLIMIIFISSWQTGLIVAITYLAIASIERAIKIKLNRQRPYEILQDVKMTQPKKPVDPSHPSGDSMRVWFMALAFPLVFNLTWPALLFSIGLAFILSMGRIILGVHYPLDVVGGAGLGLIATGTALFMLLGSVNLQ